MCTINPMSFQGGGQRSCKTGSNCSASLSQFRRCQSLCWSHQVGASNLALVEGDCDNPLPVWVVKVSYGALMAVQRLTSWSRCSGGSSFGSCTARQHQAGHISLTLCAPYCSCYRVYLLYRRFATAYQQQQRPLHVLVNNAGANYMPESYTHQGVGILCQASLLWLKWIVACSTQAKPCQHWLLLLLAHMIA